jgi:DNA mismatch endonuclease Vsr
MRLIRSKNTKPEVQLFSILSEAGIKFTTHVRLGNVIADALLDRAVVIFVDSPFWHLRDKGELKRLSPYWRKRLIKNWTRDRRQERMLRRRGYCVIRFWADRLEGGSVLRRIQAAKHRAKERSAQTLRR